MKCDDGCQTVQYIIRRCKRKGALCFLTDSKQGFWHITWKVGGKNQYSRIPVAPFLCASLLMTSFWWRQTLCPSARSPSLLIVCVCVCVCVHGRQRERVPDFLGLELKSAVSCLTLVLESKLRSFIKWKAGLTMCPVTAAPSHYGLKVLLHICYSVLCFLSSSDADIKQFSFSWSSYNLVVG